MTLNLTSCDRTPDPEPTGRMSAAQFLERLPRVEFPLHWFADYTGANIRTVKRWSDGSLDIPPWVDRMLRLHAALLDVLGRVQIYGDTTTRDIALQVEAHQALWSKDADMLAAQANRREARRRTGVPEGCSLDHINGDQTDNRIENLRIIGRDGKPVS